MVYEHIPDRHKLPNCRPDRGDTALHRRYQRPPTPPFFDLSACPPSPPRRYDPSIIRNLGLSPHFAEHGGCVNTLRWGAGVAGTPILVSGSDDRTVKLWDASDPLSGLALRGTVRTGHSHNIFCADLVPGPTPSHVLSCAVSARDPSPHRSSAAAPPRHLAASPLPLNLRSHLPPTSHAPFLTLGGRHAPAERRGAAGRGWFFVSLVRPIHFNLLHFAPLCFTHVLRLHLDLAWRHR